MTTKNEVLGGVKILSSKSLITKEELLTAYEEGREESIDYRADADKQASFDDVGPTVKRKLGLPEIFSYLGGGIVFIGIATLVAQNWSVLNFVTKILITLFAGIISYVIAVYFGKSEKTESVSMAFHVISALVLPIGLFVILDDLGLPVWGQWAQVIASAIMFLVYINSYYAYRKVIFTFFSIAFGTWLFFSVTNLIFNNSITDAWQFFQYRLMLVGLAYILIGYLFIENRNSQLTNSLYGFGILGVLSSAFTLCGWSPNQNYFWEAFFPLLVFVSIYLSVKLGAMSFLVFATIFLMMYILRITSEYFASGVGWPISLVISGLAMIGVGYMSFSFKKKYLSKSLALPE